MAKLAPDDASAWEFSPTEVTDVPDDELGEADTVVGAQAFDPTSTVEAQLAATEPPGRGRGGGSGSAETVRSVRGSVRAVQAGQRQCQGRSEAADGSEAAAETEAAAGPRVADRDCGSGGAG